MNYKWLTITILAVLLCGGLIATTIMEITPSHALVALTTIILTHIVEEWIHNKEVKK